MPEAGAPAERIRILVADDEEPIRRMMSRFLSPRYEVLAASGGGEAIQLTLDRRPSLLLLDLEMGDLHGVDVIKALKGRAETKDIPIIVLTGLATKENVVAAIKAGAADFMVKGRLNLADLDQRILKLLPKAAAPLPSPAPTAAKPKRGASPKETGFPSREEIDRRLREAIELKALPSVIAEVIRSTSDPGSDAAVLTENVSRDPAISARVLQVANSAFYVTEGRVQHLSQAITRLGFRQVRDLTIALKLVEEYAGAETRPGGLRQELWRHSIGCAILARNLASILQCSPEETEAAFMAGLLHDIGQAFLLEAFPKPYEKLLANARKKGLPVLEEERAALGVDHPEISRRLLAKWNLLDELGEAVRKHHAGGPGLPRLPALLWAADVLTRAADIGSDSETILLPIAPLTEVLPGLSREAVDEVLLDMELQVDQMSAVLQIRGEAADRSAPAPRVAPSEAVWTAEPPSAIDPVAVFLRRKGCLLREVEVLAEGVSPGAPAAAFLRARSEGWLQGQVEGLRRKSATWTAPDRPLVVVSDVAPGPALKAELKKLGAKLLAGRVTIPDLLKAVKPPAGRTRG